MKRIIIVGATGSVGRQAIDVVERHPEAFSIAGMSAHRDEPSLLALAARHPGASLCLSGASPIAAGIAFAGTDGLLLMIAETRADIVVNGIAGSHGLAPSFAALRSGKDLALANKETIVMAGRLALETAAGFGRKILPVDSEHSAIFNMVERFGREAVRGVIITASGGAFRDLPLERLSLVRPADALAHPTWNMGAKITVDSASMANKGLEVIETARLFAFSPDEIDVVVHPESRVHSFIRARDGSLYAQMSRPDMRIPIINALSWPAVMDEDVADMHPADIQISFYRPDPARYPLLGLAYQALRDGEGATDAYNAANEVAVAAFMEGGIAFTDIYRVVAGALEHPYSARLDDLEAVMETDGIARAEAARTLKEIG